MSPCFPAPVMIDTRWRSFVPKVFLVHSVSLKELSLPWVPSAPNYPCFTLKAFMLFLARPQKDTFLPFCFMVMNSLFSGAWNVSRHVTLASVQIDHFCRIQIRSVVTTWEVRFLWYWVHTKPTNHKIDFTTHYFDELAKTGISDLLISSFV